MKICVLGGGVLGVTSAYELARRGHEVTVIERNGEVARECSFANGGQLSYSHSEPWANPHVFPKLFKWMWQEDAPLVLRFNTDPHMIRWGLLFLMNCTPARARRHSEVMLRLGLYSKKKMAELMDDTKVEFHHIGKGILHLFDDAKEFDGAKKQAEFQYTLGCAETVMTAREAVLMEPALAHTSKKIVGAIHAPIDESGDIHLFSQNLAKHCVEKYNVQFRYHAPIKQVHKQGSAISHVELENGEFLSGFDSYVMAMGAPSAIYLRQVGLYVPIYPMKGYSISFAANEYVPTVSVTDSALKQVYTRLGERMRVAGTAEFAGYNDSVRKARIAPLIRGVQALFPKADLSVVDEWACLRPSTPDGPPMIGKTPLSNLYMNTGHGTLGWTQAAGSARLLADVIDGTPSEIPLTGLEIGRNLIRL
jgi:D-amino-acid dehydrogenase